MYGPYYTFEFRPGEFVQIPTGYGSDGYVYSDRYAYVGSIKQIERGDLYLVFHDGEDYVFCAPTSAVFGHRFVVSLNPRHFGTLEDIVAAIGRCEWETHLSETDAKDYPPLP